MKRRNEAGYSLIEVLVAITILGIVVLPLCSAMVMSVRMNDRTDELMRAQLAVSSAVETLMAEGIPEGADAGDYSDTRFSDVKVTVTPEKVATVGDETAILYYNIVVTSEDGLVSVSTSVDAAPTEPAEDDETDDTTDDSTDDSSDDTAEEAGA